jgi:hypothetical protein
MPITPGNPFKGRHYSGEVILLAVRYLRYPLAYEHVAEMLAERGLEVDASCVWRWVQAYGPELNKRCRPHLRPTNKSYRIVSDIGIATVSIRKEGERIEPGTGDYEGANDAHHEPTSGKNQSDLRKRRIQTLLESPCQERQCQRKD